MGSGDEVERGSGFLRVAESQPTALSTWTLTVSNQLVLMVQLETLMTALYSHLSSPGMFDARPRKEHDSKASADAARVFVQMHFVLHYIAQVSCVQYQYHTYGRVSLRQYRYGGILVEGWTDTKRQRCTNAYFPETEHFTQC